MGSKFTKSNCEEVKMEPQFWGTETNNAHKYDKFAWEAYSTSQQTQENSDTTSFSIKAGNDIRNQKEKLYPFKFEWKGLGSSVILTGSFLENWTKFVPMIKDPETEIFELVFNLPKTKHYFKFIVDNKWVCSSQYPTTMDNSNNQNNFIDLSNYTPPKELIKREEYKKGEIKAHRNKVIVILDKNEKKNYNCKYPLIHELNTNAPYVVLHYKPSFNLDYQSNQDKLKKICNEKNIEYKGKEDLTENKTYKIILPCPHEKLMHFCQSINNLNNIKNGKKKYIKGCTTIRNKHKYITIVYYKPK